MKPKRVVVIGTNHPELELYCPHWTGIQKGLSRLDVDWKFVSCRPKLDVDSVIDFEPDLVVYGLKDMVINKKWRDEIRERLPNATIVIWYGDYRDEETQQVLADCSEVDAMFVSNDCQEEYYKQQWKVPRVHFLPLGCEPIDKPWVNKKFAFNFVFIGGNMPAGPFRKRASLIERMKIDDGLTQVNSFEEGMRGKIFKKMPVIYSSSKISLDVSHFTDKPKYTSIRFWEIPAFWGFALTKRWPGCEEYYPEHSSRAYFDTYEEAIEKRDFYLSHDAIRGKMIEKAHGISKRHTYEQRFNQMFSML